MALAAVLSCAAVIALGRRNEKAIREQSTRLVSVIKKSMPYNQRDEATMFQHTIDDVLGTSPTCNSTRSLAIVCQLSGELGNNIGKFVHAYVLWLKLTRAARQPTQDQHSSHGQEGAETFSYHVVLRHAPYHVWTRAQRDAQQCFQSSLGRFNFSLGNGPDFDARVAEQKAAGWMELFDGVNTAPEDVDGALENFVQVAAVMQQNISLIDKMQDDLSDSPISLPYLWSDTMAIHPDFVEFVDDNYHEIRSLLHFDEACCAEKPFPDESVFVSFAVRERVQV